MVADVGPYGQEDALAFVVARSVAVGLTEVAGHDRTVDGRHDLGEGDVLGVAGEHVATPHATLGAYETHSLQDQQDLL
jgi:hypothetical protein